MSTVSLRTGRPLDDDYKRIDPRSGMQKDYPVLSEDETAQIGLKQPIRTVYFHQACRKETQIHRTMATTLACVPSFYAELYCSNCRKHFPSRDFYWGSGGRVGC